MRRLDDRRGSAVRALALAASPAVLAAALALAPQPVAAQAFLGTPTVVLGAGDVVRSTGPGTETITVSVDQATINWLPDDTATGGGPIDFLPAANDVLFQSGVGLPYTVLNRIIAADPSRVIALNGLVSSDPIGNVWFYAPGGLLLGGGAQFAVGGLLLTANDPVGAAAGLPFISGTSFQLAAASGSTAGMTISGGATISSASYVIAVAPRLDVAGSMSVGPGASAALVMAEDVSFTLSDGLFDITANIGTAAGGTSTVSGLITGPGGFSINNIYSRVYMMAVPRNVGMTLLIAGSAQLGFDIASAADVDGNAIVLSGGYDIVGSPIATGTNQFGAAPVTGAVAANIVVEDSQVTSNLAIRSNDFARVQTTAGNTSAAANVEIFADNQALALARNGFTLSVAGDLRVDASALPVNANGQNRSASLASVLAQTDGDIVVGNNILAFSIGAGEAALSPGLAGGSGFGGTARVSATGAGSSISGQLLIMDASGIGGAGADGAGGSGTGGFADLRVGTGASLTLGGFIDVRSDGVAELGAAGRASGNAQGGAALLELESGTALTTAGGGIAVSASGAYTETSPVPHTAGGTARGGQAEVRLQDGSTLETLGLVITADAAGPAGGGGNSFLGGQAILSVNDASGTTRVTANDDVVISASALATSGDTAGNPAGGNATGGIARINGNGNPTLDLRNLVRVQADAIGGNGAGGPGGNATGGVADIVLNDGGSLLAGFDVLISGRAAGGDGTTGGSAIATDNGDTLPAAARLRLGPNTLAGDLGIVIAGNLSLDAAATAGASSAGPGGAARAGFGVVVLDSGQLTAGDLAINADAVGGIGSAGGNAQGGRPQLVLREAVADFSGVVGLRFGAIGGAALAGSGGAGGEARGGRMDSFVLSAEGGAVARLSALAINMQATALGGAGGDGVAGGGIGGAGGTAVAAGAGMFVFGGDGLISTGSVSIDAGGVGGVGGLGTGGLAGGRGGDAVGAAGNIQVGVASGPLPVVINTAAFELGDGLFVNASMVGGAGGASGGLGGRGGDASSGLALLLNRGGTLTASQVDLDVTAAGGNGGAGDAGNLGGGNAVGGTGRVLTSPRLASGNPGFTGISSTTDVNASATGGAGTTAPGSGSGGRAELLLELNGTPLPFTGTLELLGAVQLLARGEGGGAAGAGVSGGTGTGGIVTVAGTNGELLLRGAATLDASGQGGTGGGLAGNGTGGAVSISLNGGQLIIENDLAVLARGLLGAAQGGTITMASSGAGSSLLINAPLASFNAQGLTGDGASDGGGPAVSAAGGAITIDAGAGSLLRLRQPGTVGSLELLANGSVLNFGEFSPAPGIGGSITLTAAGQLQLAGGAAGLTLNVSGEGGFGGTASNGGDGEGGSVAILARPGGQIRLDAEGQPFIVLASGTGGNSGLAGGNGRGGSISLVADGGDITVPGDASLFADGLDGLAPSRGTASGGVITLGFNNGGGLDFAGSLAGSAQSNGLVSTGGTISVSSGGGGTMTVASDLGLFANAGGSVSEDGLTVAGGSVTLSTAAGGSLSVTGQTELTADAGGFGSGNNWVATGGAVTFGTGGPTTMGGPLRLSANASFLDGGAGRASGGRVELRVLAGSVTGSSLDASAFALVGSATAAEPILGGSVTLATAAGAQMQWTDLVAIDVRADAGRLPGGTAASATGGTVTIAAEGLIALPAVPTPVTITASALGGGSDDGTGGAGTGGRVDIAASGPGGRLASGQLAVDVSGTGGDGTLGFGAGAGGTATLAASAGGAVDLATQLGLQAIGSGAPGSRAGVLQLLAQTSGQIVLGTLDLVAAGDLAPVSGRSGLVAGSGATIAIAGNALVSSVGDIGLNDGGTITAGGTLLVRSAGRVLAGFGTATAGATGTVSAADLFIEGETGVSLATALRSSSGDLGVVTGGLLSVGDLESARHVVLLAGGDIATGGIVTGAAGMLYVGDESQRSLIAFPAGAPPDYAALLASLPLRLGGGISIGGDIETDLLSLAADGPILFGGTFAATSVVLDSSTGVTLAGTGSTAGALTITSGGDAALADMVVSGGISVTAAGRASLSGTITANSIAVTSADIAIGIGSIGGAGTGSIRLTSTAASAVIGGSGTPAAGVYGLSDAEFGVLRASSIVVRNPAGSMTIEQLGLPAIAPGTAALPGVRFDAAGLVRVSGAVTMPLAGADNRLALVSGTRIEVVQGAGSILLGSSALDPAGILSLAAPSVRVATEPLLAQIAAGTLSGTARDAALNATPVGGAAAGTIAAGTIAIDAANDVLIQNSGTLLARAGFTAGPGGLVITASGGPSVPLDVVINGRIRTGAGLFATNAATVDLVEIRPALSALTPASTANSCLFGEPCFLIDDVLLRPIVTLLTSVEPLTPEEQQARERLAEPAEKLPVVMQQRMFDFGPLFSDVDATDPATSGGNPALWREQPPSPPAGRPTGGQE